MIDSLLRSIVVILLFVALPAIAPVQAQNPSPNTFTQQGLLVSGDSPISETVDMTFELGRKVDAGTIDFFYQETQTVEVIDGRYNVRVGSNTEVQGSEWFPGDVSVPGNMWVPGSRWFPQDMVLQTSVDGETLSPAQPLSSTPYSFLSSGLYNQTNLLMASDGNASLLLNNDGDGNPGEFAIFAGGSPTQVLHLNADGTTLSGSGTPLVSNHTGSSGTIADFQNGGSSVANIGTDGVIEASSGGFRLPDGTLLDEASDLGGFTIPFSSSNASTSPLLNLEQTGDGKTAVFETSSSSNDAAALQGLTDGTGDAVRGVNAGSGGSAGTFVLSESTNGADAVQVISAGTGAGVAVTGGRDGVVSSAADRTGIRSVDAGKDGILVKNAGEDGIDVESAAGNAGEFGGNVYVDGDLGVGATTPEVRMHVRESVRETGATNLGRHAGVIENTSTETGADVLGLKTSLNDPNSFTNFISFLDADEQVGTIHGDGNGGIGITGTSADYAEELPVTEGMPPPEANDLVGVWEGTVSRKTSGADRVMIASESPLMTGNATPATRADDDRRVEVAFIGQVPVKLRGPAQPGDLVVPSGKDDGTARAVAPTEYRRSKHGPIAGQAWSAKTSAGVGEVTVAVGLGSGGTLAHQLDDQRRRNQKQQQQIADLRAENKKIKKRLDALEAERSVSLPAGITGTVASLLFALLLSGLLGAGLLWRGRT